jgi:hypothetical protein
LQCALEKAAFGGKAMLPIWITVVVFAVAVVWTMELIDY